MKALFLIIFLTVAILSACSSDENNTELNKELEKSLLIWDSEKSKNDGSYTYTTGFTSWVGFGYRGTIVVKNNEIVERHHVGFSAEDASNDSWREITPDTLGSHTYGAELKLIDELYIECERDVLRQDSSTNYIYLTFHPDGLLKQCSYSPKNCADDCSFGVRIDSVSFPNRE